MTPRFWPDFAKADLVDAMAAYQQRDRRFGKTAAATANGGGGSGGSCG